MVSLHKPNLYDNCKVVESHSCVDGITRAALLLPDCIKQPSENTSSSCADRIRDRLGDMRICLVWYSQIRLPHQPSIDYIEQKFGDVDLHCGMDCIADKQVESFMQMA